jgi:surface antigen
MIARPVSSALLCLALALSPGLSQAKEGGKDQPAHTTGAKFVKVRKAAAEDVARSELKAAVAHAESTKPRKGRYWCVPFARQVSGIEIKGNAATWWHKAGGKYERGSLPQIGAVMNFRASKAMPMGHVAVVSKVVDERQVLVDQANWIRNRITKDTLVVDVSAQNDWSQVRVANADGTLGRSNPVYGFIYR